MKSYWSSLTEQRLSRRRAVLGAGGLAAGAALLAACGGGSSSPSSQGGAKDSSGILFKPVDETKAAKRGGTYIGLKGNAISSVDPHKIGAHGAIVQRVYSELFRVSDGYMDQTSGAPQGDLAESWEMSPDKLTLTVKLDPGAAFGPQAPVNGRPVDVDDILYSWERFKATGQLRGDISNEVSPGAPIVSVTAPDKRTIVIKLAEPNVTIFTLLSHDGLGSYYIVPKEASEPSKLDLGNRAIGSGPYYLTDSSELVLKFKRNPNFKRTALKDNEPYIDEIEMPVIPDTATVTAQFRTGALYEAENAIRKEELLGIKRDIPALRLYATLPPSTERWYFGQNPDSPFRDERMRIAYHKCIDRNEFVAAAYNTDQFKKEGLPVEEFWQGSFGRKSWAGAILDPKSEKDYGPAAKNFLYDLAEAKKLVEAAGYKTPFEYTQVESINDATSFGPAIYKRTEIVMGMLNDSKVFQVKRKGLQWAVEWVPQVRNSKGLFNGASWGPDTASADLTSAAFFVYNTKGGYFEGNDATLEELAVKVRREFDDKARGEILKELQRYDAAKMFNQGVGVARSFDLAWPVVRNLSTFQGGTNWLDINTKSGLHAYLDPSQPPLKKA